MSAKWRRSIKHRKWLDFDEDLNDDDVVKCGSTKSLRSEFTPIKPVKSARYGQSFRVPKIFSKRKFGDPKPLIDIFQESNWITVVAEIAGFNKESFKINVKDQKITLTAKSKERRYYKSLNLPKAVIPSDIHTTFKNGVLEIKLKKAEIHTNNNKQSS
ncbi:MAG: Hsp20/alpha crystallin family protein [Candidatus Bathyarchaeota archaeon]|uniref:Hsp20/alpha crystallin family protein n=1 Tax=Candidatus Bathycorpusculum sp. TaxID=2994959 RepID=UPI002836151C|nr:Hsp20/alpha crystallin family protein [Candidatus Termiticorpusculum sp.]MCL2291814.1 Hsp20/alpha crystallin family protein [Candidatus Termiticorpusculum sp.]